MSASLAPERLAVPESVSPRWNRLYLATIVVVHVLGLLAFVPYFFHWAFPIVAILGIHVFGQGITIGYHRMLTHRSFKAPRWVERGWAILGICCLQDTPVKWVATHRMHHVHSDERPDPHTPKVSFLWSHFGWLAYENSATQGIGGIEKFAKDLLRDPFYLWLEKNRYGQFLIVLAQFLVFFAVGAAIGAAMGGPWKALQMGSGLVVWGVIVRTILVWHITWSVNSLSHLFGYRSYDTGEDSRNNWFVALVTVGEGWHNNHHEDPSAASVQHRWWEIDISYWEILLMERLGLAYDVIPVRSRRRAARTEAPAVESPTAVSPVKSDEPVAVYETETATP